MVLYSSNGKKVLEIDTDVKKPVSVKLENNKKVDIIANNISLSIINKRGSLYIKNFVDDTLFIAVPRKQKNVCPECDKLLNEEIKKDVKELFTHTLFVLLILSWLLAAILVINLR